MKFSSFLKSVGLITNDSVKSQLNIAQQSQAEQISVSDIEGLRTGFQHYHSPNIYHQRVNLGMNPAIRSYYYPSRHNTFGQRSYGLRLNIGGHTRTQGGVNGGYGPVGGYSHTGYDTHTEGNSGGIYDYRYSTSHQKSKGSSVMTALTLLSFFFFINLLQSCLKEHMDTMNPTVMVMTAGIARNKLNKFAEINSRELSDSIGTANREKSQLLNGNEERTPYPNTTIIREFKIEPKLKNDYFRDGSTLYTRIN